MFKKYKMMRKLEGPRTMGVAMFWSECGVKVISYLCASILLAMVLSAVLPMSTEQITQIVEYAACVLAVLWCIPIVRNTRYRLRDAGYTAKAYLWLLLPVIGWLIFIALLLTKSKHATAGEAERGIDSWHC